MKNRGERRDVNERKWISRLKQEFYSGWRTYVQPIKTSNWSNYYKAKTYDELKSDRFGVLLKKTGTIWSDKRLDIQEEHKRNLANRSLSEEDKKELDDCIELMENPYAFEDYCDACDYFDTDDCPFRDKVNGRTEWKKIGCNSFWD